VGLLSGSAPIPVAALSAPTEALLGQDFTYTVTFDNASPDATGYGPYLDLVLPATGADGAGAALDDGVTFVGASYLGGAVESYTATFDASGQATHPFAKTSSGAPLVVSGTPGDQLVALRLPYHSFTPDQPVASVSVTAHLDDKADAGTPLTLSARAGFALGADPLDNPVTDPPLLQSPWVTAQVRPTLFTLAAGYVGPEDETATGPNFPRQYRVTVDVASGQTITNLDLTDVLPNTLQFVQVDATTIRGTPATTTAVSTPSTTAPGGTLTRRFASVTGTTAADDAEVLFTFHAPRLDSASANVLSPTTGAARAVTDDVKAQGQWTPTDPRDPPGTVSSDARPDDHTLTLRSLAAQQSVAVVNDTGYAGATPGDTLEYTMSVQVSDFFSFDQVVLGDRLSDGQRFDASFTPTLQVNGNGYTLAAQAFNSSNYTVTPRYSTPPGDGNPADGTDGTTGLAFRVSDEVVTRGQNGRLLGGLVSPSGGLVAAPGDGPTTVTVKFRAVVQEAYTDAYAPPNQVVKQGDALTASGDVTGRLLDNSTFSPTGSSVSDTHAASTSVPRSDLAVSVYAVNGSTSVPAYVQAGDTVTYRLKYDLRTGDVRDVSLNDYLPPVFAAASVSSFDYATSSATPPALNAARLGPADTFHGYYPSVVPTMGSGAANNALTFTYGSLSDALDRPSTIDILFTVQVSGDPYPDGLLLTNLGRSSESGSAPGAFTVERTAAVPLFEPLLRVTKGAVTSSPSRSFSPAAVGPAGVTFGAPGSPTSFTGTISSSGLASQPVNSNVSQVDALDLVRFAVVVENVGRGPAGAFAVRVKDTMPAGFAVPAGGLNLKVTDGTGAAFGYADLGGGLFGAGIELADPGPTASPSGGLDPGRDTSGNTINTGRNIAVLTYDLQIVDSITAQDLTNTATVTRYASVEGGPSFSDNSPSDTATASVGPWLLVGGGGNKAVGELVTYGVTVFFPEGATTNAVLTDTLPDGLAVVSLDDLISPSPALTTSVPGGFAAALDNARPLLAEPGRTVSVDLGTVTNSTRNNILRSLTLVMTAVVTNTPGNQGGVVLNDQAAVSYGGGLSSSVTGAPVTILEPALQVSVTPSPTAADTLTQSVTYTVVISHAAGSTADAFDLALTDVLPAGLLYEPGSLAYSSGVAPTSLSASGAVLRASYAQLALGQTSTLTFRAKLSSWTEPGQVVSNTPGLTWTSLPGDVTVYQSRYSSVSVERTGSVGDPGGAANDYRAAAGADVGVLGNTLSGFVYHYANGNGVKDAGEAGIQGATLTLAGTDHLGAAVTRTAVTGFDGGYSFPLLRPGAYTVTETQPSGWTDGADAVGSPTLGAAVQANDVLGVFTFPTGSATASVNNNFGEASAPLAGHVYADANWNGALDAGESGIGGVLVMLKDASGVTVGTRTTAADGSYSFGAVAPGLYTVVETQPAGYGSSTPDTVPVNLALAGQNTVDFGETPCGLSQWGTGEDGGSAAGKGTVTDVSGDLLLREGDSFLVWAEKTFTVPARPGVLRLSYNGLSFDTTSQGTIRDAFEAALVDPATGRAVVLPYAAGREAAFNITEGLPAATGRGAAAQPGLVSFDLSGLTPGSQVKLIVRLVNDDLDDDTQVRVHCVDLATGAAAKFFVVDDAVDATYRYDSSGGPLGNTALLGANGQPASPRGAASNADGSRVWVVDAARTVWVYDGYGTPVGSWQAGDAALADPQGVTVSGGDVWLVDGATKKVYRYAGAAGRTSGTQSASSSFALHADDAQPTDLVTDGTRVWVTDDGTNEVFVYDLSGALLGRSALDARNGNPSGVTINPAGGTELWVVDRQDLVVYRYAAGRSQMSGGLAASDTFPLAAGQGRPEGIADPPVDSLGTDLWLTFPYRNDFGQTPQTHQLRVYLTGRTATTGSVSVPGYFDLPFEVTPGKVTTIDVPQFAGLGAAADAVFAGKGIHVTAFAEVSAYALHRTRWTTDSSLVLPTDSLGTEYIVASFNNLGTDTSAGTQLAVLAAEDNTQVTVTPAISRGGNPPGTPFTLTLQKGDVYQLADAGLNSSDLTGTIVQSDRPVAVFGAHRGARVPVETPHTDMLLEQLPPVSAWGTRFFALPYGPLLTDTLRVIGSANDTHVTVTTYPTGGGSPVTSSYTIQRGGFAQLTWPSTPDGPKEITADKPVLAVQYMNSNSYDDGGPFGVSDPMKGKGEAPVGSDDSFGALDIGSTFIGDPDMTLVPAVTWYTGRYDVAVPRYDSADQTFSEGQAQSRLSVVARTADAASLRLNGQPISGFQAIGSTGYSWVRLTPAGGQQQTLLSVTGQPFGLTGFGYEDFDSYGWLGGAVLPSSGPAIQVESPAEGGAYASGQVLLVTGRATPGSATAPIVRVTVDGQAVEALDAAGHFFTRVTVQPGRNSFRFQATDSLGRIATTFLTLTGQDAVAPTEGLLDVAAFSAEYARTSFVEQSDLLHADFVIRNNGAFALTTPLLLTVEDISDPQAALAGYDGRLADGTPYYDLSALVAGGRLLPGEATGTRTLTFSNPGKRRFTYRLALRAGVNHAPAFTSVPNLEVVATKGYSYKAQAADQDGDPVAYSLVSAPAGMTVSPSGQISWTPGSGVVGRHSIVVKADDGRGGSALQRYELTVLPTSANRAPVFYTPPVVTANVGSPYAYAPDVRDLDGDAVSVGLSGPAGASYTGGQVVWTPTPDQVGSYTLTLTASDGALSTQQTFTVVVGPVFGNHAPVITSTALTSVRVGAAYQYQVRAQDEDRDALTYAVSSATLTGLAIDANGLVSWTAPGSATSGSVTVTASDGKGGVAQQTFTLGVLNVTPATVSGVVFDDADGDGVQQGGEAGQPGWTVFVDRDGDGRRSPGEWYAATDSGGAYSVAGVLPGSYTLRAERPYDRGFTLPAGGTRAVSPTAGQALTGQHFGVTAQSNRQPTLSGTPAAAGVVGTAYAFTPSAADLDNDPLTFDLPVRPAGMFVHPVTGVLSWTPTADQVGANPVLLRVQDGQGGVALLSFNVTVAPANHRPFIVSYPQNGPVELGLTYRYQVAALDADPGDTLTYTKLSPTPSGVVVNSSTGLVTWDPQATGASAGTYTFSLQAADAAGLTAVQTFTVEVGGGTTDRPPVIISTPRTTAGVGRQYLYPVRAVDPDGNPFTVSLVSPPAGMTLSADNVVSWTPAAPGSYTVQVKVSDGKYLNNQVSPANEYRHVQTFTLTVTPDAPANHDPVIVSAPPKYADANSLYGYNVLAADPDDDPVTYALAAPTPDGVVLDQATGALRWRPAAWQLGYQTIHVRALDRFGAAADHTFTVLVRDTNRPPLITSVSSSEAEVGQYYAYAIRVEDPDGDAVSLSLTGSVPPGLALADGVVKGTPTTAGTYDFTVRAEDARGAITEQPVRVVVSPVLNWPPVITSDPVLNTATGAGYSYQVAATDPDAGDAISYTVTTSPSVSLSVSGSGLVSWAVPSNYVAAGQTASVTVTVRATDNGTPSRYAEQNYTLAVHGNRAPALAAVGAQAVTAGNPFRLDLAGSDPDGDALTYTLTGRNTTAVPADLTVDGLGRVRWAGTLVGSYDFTAKARDPYGLSASRDFTLTVSADTQAPGVRLEVQDDPGRINQGERFRVDAADDVAVTERKLEVSPDGTVWTVVGLDAEGVGRWTFTTPAVYQLRATARDAAGNTGTFTRSLTVIDPAATQPPVVAITAPAADAKVTTLTTVTGTITDDGNLLSWKLEYSAGGAWKTIKEVTSGLGTSVSVNESFDPTLLANGPYTLRLTATDTGGNVGVATRTVQVDGRLKLGNLTFSATDLTIPVAGIPITVGRTYDTLDADTVGDFGNGWRLNLGLYRATVDQSTTAPSFLNSYPTFKDGTRVYVKRPDGGIDGYTFTPVPASVLFGNVLSWYPYFTPDAGVLNLLQADQVELVKIPETGEYIDYAIGGYNPANPSFGGAFDVAEFGGLKHEVDAQEGAEVSVRDRNDNELTFTGDAIVSNRGVQVTFERDALGRIVFAEDPRGNKVRYRYDSRGDLVEVTDRLGIVIASYGYRTTDPLHYLTSVTDADGTRTLEGSYYQGTEPGSQPYFKDRLKEVKDAEGNAATTSYTLTTSQRGQSVSVPKPGGGTTTTQASYDEWGNPVDVKQAVGSPDQTWSTSTYSTDLQKQRGTPSEVREVKGQIDPAGGENDDVVTTLTYDANGLVASTTDALGGVTRRTFGPNGELLTVSDPLGNTTTSRYDGKGNLLQTTSQEGVSSTFEHDARGLVTRQTQGLASTLMGYDTVGRLTGQTTPTGVTTATSYDANGNQTGTSFVWVNPNNPADQQTVTTGVTYDANDQATRSTDERNNLSQTEFDRLGRAVRSTDPRGGISETVYDARGLAVEGRSPDGTVTRTAYDALGRAEWATDPFVPGTPATGTKTVYDERGRVVRTERYADVVIDIVTTAGSTRGVFVSSATTPLSTSTSVYDSLGRMTESGSTGYATSKQTYDRLGRVTRDESWDGTTLLSWTETTYDAAGRAVTGKDALGHVTRTQYDGDGRAAAVFYADGTMTRTEYDRLGRKVADVDQLGRRTEYGYDAQGRLTEVRQPAVPDPLNGGALTVPVTAYAYDDYGKRTQTTDARGRVTRWTYDQYGQQLTRTLPDVAGQPTAVESMTYNGYGQVLTHTDFKGQVTKYFYDTDPGRVDPQNPSLRLGRMTAAEYYVNAGASAPAETVQYRYDDKGRRDKVIDSVSGTTGYDYDGEGRLLRVVGPAGLAQTINYAYDPATGQQTRMWTDQSETQYAYDKLGRLQAVTLVKRDGAALANPEQTGYAFDPVGNLTGVTQKVGTAVVLTSTLGYDLLNRRTSHVNKDGLNNTLSNFAYTRLADGSIATLSEAVKQPDGSTVSTTTSYTYDALGRLTREQVDTAGTADDYTADYTLDLVGNRTKKLTTKGSGAVERVEGAFDARDRLVQELFYNSAVGGTLTNTLAYGYDANGSLTSRTARAGGSLSQTWGVRGRLQGATDVQGGTTRQALYRYDPDGIRSREEVTTTTGGVTTRDVQLLLVDHQSPAGYAEVVEERTESGLIVASYVYGVGLDPISTARTGQPVGLYLIDGHSGVRQIVDLTAASVLAAYGYDSFGVVLAQAAAAGGFVNPAGYRGERIDPVLGMSYNRARLYDPRTGRFTAIDPFSGRLSDPRSLHKYLYAYANPVNGMDPSGRDPNGAGASVGLTAGTAIAAIGLPGVMMALLLMPAWLPFLTRYGRYRKGACFAAGTPLLTPEGSKPIEQFREGDLVLSRDESDPEGVVQAKAVQEVFADEACVLELHVGGRAIRTTAEHPFWAVGKGWLPASSLVQGDLLLTADGGHVAVEQVAQTLERVRVYNLRVADFHTYFVGCDEWGFSVWAHNACVSLGIRGGLAEFALRTGGVPYWGWRDAGLTTLPVEPLEVFPAAFAEATANAEWIYFNLRHPFSAERALDSPDDWLAPDNVTNMEYKALVFNPLLVAKTTFVP
jgi:RHS repeat-associated protein/uncharacterized repeat protein (TIGR01451 family)